CRRAAARRTTTCGDARPPCSRADETTVAPLSNPHRFRDDELRADDVAVDLAPRQPGVLPRERVVAFDPQPALYRVAQDAVHPGRSALLFQRVEWSRAPPRERFLRVEAVVGERHLHVARHVVGARRSAEAERWREAAAVLR